MYPLYLTGNISLTVKNSVSREKIECTSSVWENTGLFWSWVSNEMIVVRFQYFWNMEKVQSGQKLFFLIHVLWYMKVDIWWVSEIKTGMYLTNQPAHPEQTVTVFLFYAAAERHWTSGHLVVRWTVFMFHPAGPWILHIAPNISLTNETHKRGTELRRQKKGNQFSRPLC